MYFSTCRGWFIFNMSGIHSPQRLPPLTLTFCLTFRSCGCCLSFAVAFLLPAAHTHPPHASPQVRSDPWVEKGGAGHKGRVKEEGEEEEDDDEEDDEEEEEAGGGGEWGGGGSGVVECVNALSHLHDNTEHAICNLEIFVARQQIRNPEAQALCAHACV